MKILLSNVKESSREFQLEGPLSLESLAGRGGPGKVEVQVKVHPAGERWYISGAVRGYFPFLCDRCGVSYDGELTGEFSLVVLAKQVSGLEPDESEEVQVLASGTQEVDLSEKVTEALLLDLPIQLLCQEDCRGLCARCGANLNRESCACEAEEDPRWSALKDLKKLMESADGKQQDAASDDESEV